MHTYLKSKNEPLWTVGHYQTIGYEAASSEQRWQPMVDFDTEKEAAAYVSYLNGGDHPSKPFPPEVV